MTRLFKDFLQEELQDSEFAREYNALQPASMVAQQVIELRQAQGMSQTELAHLVGTKQSGISRLENAASSPSLSFLYRIAEALDADLNIQFVPRASKGKLQA